MKVVNQVNQTSDYARFKTLQGNRNVNKLHIRRLTESFSKAYLLSPIVVNQNYEIIDGQHRFEAAKELNLPINFIICSEYSLKEVQLLNTNMRNWSKADYLNTYCDLGYPEYLKFREFMSSFPEFGLFSCEIILTDNASGANYASESKALRSESNQSGTYLQRFFQEGDLHIPNYDKSIQSAENIMMIKPYYEGFNRPLFIRSMIGIFKIEYYQHSKFIDRLSANPTAMQHCSNVGQYKLMIEEIYNYRSREKVSLRY